MVSGTVLRVESFREARKPAYKILGGFRAYGERKNQRAINGSLYAPKI